jgi:hypothetical protein
MRKYTYGLCECYNCGKRNNFLIVVVKKNKKAYYLTQCPKCKKYDEIKEITQAEFESFRPQEEGKA